MYQTSFQAQQRANRNTMAELGIKFHKWRLEVSQSIAKQVHVRFQNLFRGRNKLTAKMQDFTAPQRTAINQRRALNKKVNVPLKTQRKKGSKPSELPRQDIKKSYLSNKVKTQNDATVVFSYLDVPFANELENGGLNKKKQAPNDGFSFQFLDKITANGRTFFGKILRTKKKGVTLAIVNKPNRYTTTTRTGKPMKGVLLGGIISIIKNKDIQKIEQRKKAEQHTFTMKARPFIDKLTQRILDDKVIEKALASRKID